MYGIKEIDVNELSQQLENLPPNVKLIDVRTPAEVARGKISGSENLPLHVIPLKVDEFNNEDKIIFYCQTGARSAQACAFMTSKGVDNVYNLRGGIVTWAQMGLPIAV
ncbi:MAG: rhodanese-like domain-containing protein [gamma proteobacterium symbiont of Bathyaustriella thionipta]|nr:rhodanese-like domain-containing protein [gamma proteobacterium symbiont of Bathyaustriella thionipta]MCU7949906.1 rhodanese-like domain-containing protein [gamma proteobacterium symbiont of Bathyaustriella thionipta]MCU7953476.1 rhodanese-like domain-containing protein [gamma proteobacterium symbiont of Bathyaustriella thionipta]MCU7955575.1 rhodanese-like domain-containing protein [gamma proteobacterium symbiont of Bathyaustriella thionipta]